MHCRNHQFLSKSELRRIAQANFAEHYGLEVPPRPEEMRLPSFIDPNNSLEQWKRGEGTPQHTHSQMIGRCVWQQAVLLEPLSANLRLCQPCIATCVERISGDLHPPQMDILLMHMAHAVQAINPLSPVKLARYLLRGKWVCLFTRYENEVHLGGIML